MKKNYKLKVILAILVIVLISIVSFVGVYNGKSQLKDYTFGKDFADKKLVILSAEVISDEETSTDTEESSESTDESETSTDSETSDENTTSESIESSDESSTSETTENSEESATEESSEETTSDTEESASDDSNSSEETSNSESSEKKDTRTDDQKREDSKNIVEQRLQKIGSADFDLKYDSATGNIAIEIPADMDTSIISEIIAQGEISATNSSTGDELFGAEGIKSETLTYDDSTYTVPVYIRTLNLTSAAKKIINNQSEKYTDSDGNETDANISITLDGSSMYSGTVEETKKAINNGGIELQAMKAEAEQSLRAEAAVVNTDELAVTYTAEDAIMMENKDKDYSVCIIVAAIIAIILIGIAVIKFKGRAILPMLSLVGLVGLILLTFRYTNVTITYGSILGVVVMTVINYVLILRMLSENKTFKEKFMDMLNLVLPFLCVAVVFCYAPYVELTTLGMSIFWGTIVMFIYNFLITRIFVDNK